MICISAVLSLTGIAPVRALTALAAHTGRAELFGELLFLFLTKEQGERAGLWRGMRGMCDRSSGGVVQVMVQCVCGTYFGWLFLRFFQVSPPPPRRRLTVRCSPTGPSFRLALISPSSPSRCVLSCPPLSRSLPPSLPFLFSLPSSLPPLPAFSPLPSPLSLPRPRHLCSGPFLRLVVRIEPSSAPQRARVTR